MAKQNRGEAGLDHPKFWIIDRNAIAILSKKLVYKDGREIPSNPS